MSFATMPFAGPASVYGTNGWYKWGGKSTCGISKASGSTACNFTLHPQGPGLDPMSNTGLAGGVGLPTPGKCGHHAKGKGTLLNAGNAMAAATAASSGGFGDGDNDDIL